MSAMKIHGNEYTINKVLSDDFAFEEKEPFTSAYYAARGFSITTAYLCKVKVP